MCSINHRCYGCNFSDNNFHIDRKTFYSSIALSTIVVLQQNIFYLSKIWLQLIKCRDFITLLDLKRDGKCSKSISCYKVLSEIATKLQRCGNQVVNNDRRIISIIIIYLIIYGREGWKIVICVAPCNTPSNSFIEKWKIYPFFTRRQTSGLDGSQKSSVFEGKAANKGRHYIRV